MILVHADFLEILAATKQFREVWSEKNPSGESLSFEQLSTEAGAIAKWLGDTIKRRSPTFSLDEDAQSSGEGESDDVAGAAGSSPTGPIKSAAQAVGALNAVARYYALFEPSSPARLLISLSEQMIGKTFAEIVRILTPNHVEQAAIKIGTNVVVDLPILRMAEPLEQMAVELPAGADEPQPEYIVENRAQAIVTIDQISSFFRTAEPSSPIPMLLERIRDLGQRDFLYLLRSVLPTDALKPPE
ncbi:MAG: hypothetical protein JSS22_00380 [Proteobacteria bacterium]|nr:hypothetical protein [Pseudomonadota bacterium]